MRKIKFIFAIIAVAIVLQASSFTLFAEEANPFDEVLSSSGKKAITLMPGTEILYKFSKSFLDKNKDVTDKERDSIKDEKDIETPSYIKQNYNINVDQASQSYHDIKNSKDPKDKELIAAYETCLGVSKKAKEVVKDEPGFDFQKEVARWADKQEKAIKEKEELYKKYIGTWVGEYTVYTKTFSPFTSKSKYIFKMHENEFVIYSEEEIFWDILHALIKTSDYAKVTIDGNKIKYTVSKIQHYIYTESELQQYYAHGFKTLPPDTVLPIETYVEEFPFVNDNEVKIHIKSFHNGSNGEKESCEADLILRKQS
jgi:hypothetical protein